MSTEKRVPEIRFDGLREGWHEIQLSDEVTFINGRAYSQEELQVKGKYPVLRVGNFYTNSSWYYSDLELSEKYYAHCGDLLYTWSASFGPHIWGGEKVIYHYHIWKLVLSEKIDKLFLLQLLEYDREMILSGSSGSTMIHITKSGMESKKLIIPNKEEQTQIGNYFQKLDSLISQHQQKHDKLCNLKKAMLEKMFPKQGETTPNIRFKGFSGEWEEVRLGDVVTCFSGGTPMVGVEEYYKGNIPFIRSAEINKATTELTISESGLKNSSAKMIEVGTVLYALYGATSGEVGRAKLCGAINQAILAIIPIARTCPEFLSQWLRKSKSSIVSTYLQGGQGNLSGDIVKNLVLMSPTFEEQTAIGNYFQKLDTLINQHQQQITKLNNIKQACLSKMFV